MASPEQISQAQQRSPVVDDVLMEVHVRHFLAVSALDVHRTPTASASVLVWRMSSHVPERDLRGGLIGVYHHAPVQPGIVTARLVAR